MLVLGGKRSFLQHLHQSYLTFDVVDETGTQAWCSPRVHSLCSGVCKTKPPEERGVCVSQAQRGSLALPDHFWELTHNP